MILVWNTSNEGITFYEKDVLTIRRKPLGFVCAWLSIDSVKPLQLVQCSHLSTAMEPHSNTVIAAAAAAAVSVTTTSFDWTPIVT